MASVAQVVKEKKCDKFLRICGQSGPSGQSENVLQDFEEFGPQWPKWSVRKSVTSFLRICGQSGPSGESENV